MCGPVSAVKEHCTEYFVIKQGDEKISDVGKKINHKLNISLDDIIRVLPTGNCALIKP